MPGCHGVLCPPYCSWERAPSENHNGLLRQYFPKKMTLEGVTQIEVDGAVHSLNDRPRKCLKYRTPHGVLRDKSGAAYIVETRNSYLNPRVF